MDHLLKYKLTIAYDGTHYAGWQIQPNALAIQEVIQQTLLTLLKTHTPLVASGRTDAGVHAKRQVAHFCALPLKNHSQFLLSLNALLPPAIRVLQLEEVPNTFHAQRSALAKTYHYHVWTKRIIDPFVSPYRHICAYPLSIPNLVEATSYFIGERDFISFTNRGSSAKTTVRHLYRLDYIEQEGGFRLEFEGNGFLYKMVRNITGTLLEVARGKKELTSIPDMFAAEDRRAAGIAAPPKGLFLMQVDYPQNPQSP